MMKPFRILLPALWALLLSLPGRGQVGGEGTFQFLNLTSVPLAAASGGYYPATAGSNPLLALENPALLDSAMHNQLAMGFTPYLADIRYGQGAYARYVPRIGMLAAGVQYIDYGSFQAANEAGMLTGQFEAAEYALSILWRYPLVDSSLYAGIKATGIRSQLERYTASGLAADVGLYYKGPDGNFGAALLARNLGAQLKTYTTGTREALPANLVLSLSQKLEHAPFKFNLHLHHLHRWDMRHKFLKDNTTGFFDEGQTTAEPRWERMLSEMLYHVSLGVELHLLENFILYTGYHHQRRQEMALANAKGMQGFSFGAMLDLQRFGVSYGRSVYHIAGASNHLGLQLKLTNW